MLFPQAFRHKIASDPSEESSCFAWISTNPCFSKSFLYSSRVRSLPSTCTSIFREVKRVLLGPVLSSSRNLSAIRTRPPKVSKCKVQFKNKCQLSVLFFFFIFFFFGESQRLGSAPIIQILWFSTCTSIFREVKMHFLGPILSSSGNLSTMRTRPPKVSKCKV